MGHNKDAEVGPLTRTHGHAHQLEVELAEVKVDLRELQLRRLGRIPGPATGL